MMIGLTVGLLLNLHMPKDKNILPKIIDLDSEMNDIVQKIANGETAFFDNVMQKLTTLESTIKIELENASSPTILAHLKYVDMIREQIYVLKRINSTLNVTPESDEKQAILDLLKEFNGMIGHDNYAQSLDDKLENLIEELKTRDLTVDKEEFEARAQLYYTLIEIDKFLNLKLVFRQIVGFLRS